MKTKHFFLALGGLLLGLQFFPVNRHLPPTDSEMEFHAVQKPPGEVMTLLKHACYDCHSNQTRWPWYARVQPVGWWLRDHVRKGRAELNFSAFGRLDPAERRKALERCAKMVGKGAMPPRSYGRMHPEARLDSAQKALLIAWLLHPAPGEAAPGRRLAANREAPGDCDGEDPPVRCCFAGMPAALTAVMVIAPDDEPGERLVIQGRVLQADGRTPVANVLLYAYHTDAGGKYSRRGDETGIQRRHGGLHGWCRTDAEGRYEIQTIRPAHYPGNTVAAHIHAAAWPAGRDEPFYLQDFLFADDPLVKKMPPRQTRGVVAVRKDVEGVWRGRRNIVLPR